MAEGPETGKLEWVTVDSTIALGQTITLQSEKVFVDKVNGNDIAVNIYEDSYLLDTVNVPSDSQLYYSYTPNTVGVHSLQYGNTGGCEILYITVTSNSMTDKVVIKTDIVTPLKETFEQKSKKKTSWSSTTSDDNYPSEKLVKDSLDGKLDKVHSSNKGKNVVTNASTGAIEFENKPTIPTKTSDLTNDADGTSGATYVLSNDSRLTDNRTPTSHTHGNLTNDGKVGTASGQIICTGTGGAIQAVGNISTGMMKDSNAHSHIGSSANDTQETINTNIDTALSNKADSSSLSNYILTSKILSDISTATDNTQLVGAKELKDEIDALRGEVPTGVELTANKKSSWSSTTTNTNYPSEKLVKDSLDAKMDDTQLVTSISNTSDDSHVPSAKAVYDYVASVPKWTTQVANTVSNLPQTGSVGVFYLVPNNSSQDKNSYDEYFWNGSAYEKFGTRDIDISNLVTLDDVLTYINNNGSLSLPTSGTDAGYLVFKVT